MQKAVPEDLMPGDFIVYFKTNARISVSDVLQKLDDAGGGNPGVSTSSNSSETGYTETVANANIYGKVTGSIPFLGSVFSWIRNNQFAMVFILIILVVSVMVLLLVPNPKEKSERILSPGKQIPKA
jgi:hypothetical protein